MALLRIPAFARATVVSFALGAPATAVVLLTVDAATVTYRVCGMSSAYYVADLIEGLTTEAFDRLPLWNPVEGTSSACSLRRRNLSCV